MVKKKHQEIPILRFILGPRLRGTLLKFAAQVTCSLSYLPFWHILAAYPTGPLRPAQYSSKFGVLESNIQKSVALFPEGVEAKLWPRKVQESIISRELIYNEIWRYEYFAGRIVSNDQGLKDHPKIQPVPTLKWPCSQHCESCCSPFQLLFPYL